MISSLLKNSSSSIFKEKFHWKSIFSRNEIVEIDEETMLIGFVKNRQETNEIIRLLNEMYPWTNSLKHIRRLNQHDEQLEILLYPKTFFHPNQKDFQEKFFLSDRFDEAKLPLKPFSFRFQYENYLKTSPRWKNISFRLNPTNEFLIENQKFTDQHFEILQMFQNLEERFGSSSRFALIRNDSNGEIYSIGKDFRDENPLQHSTMVAIDLLGKNSFFHRENLRPKQFETNEKSSHLLNGCSIYLTDEPCLMCSMALLHSRISSVFFLRSNNQHGSLLSNYNLHRLKQTNHRFHVYQLEQIDQ